MSGPDAFCGGSLNFKPLDVIVLKRGLESHGLKCGDLGAVVDVYESNALQVEFVTASGRTEALLTLDVADVRSVGDSDRRFGPPVPATEQRTKAEAP